MPADDPTEAADITSLLALIEEPSEEAHTSTAPAPAPGATLRRRLRQTTADDPTESADLTSLLALIEEPSEEVEVSVAPGPGIGRHLLEQVSTSMTSEYHAMPSQIWLPVDQVKTPTFGIRTLR